MPGGSVKGAERRLSCCRARIRLLEFLLLAGHSSQSKIYRPKKSFLSLCQLFGRRVAPDLGNRGKTKESLKEQHTFREHYI